MRPRVLFYVQHLLGIGHLVRAGRIAAALAGSFEVLPVVGGELPPGLAFDRTPLILFPSLSF